MTAGSRVLVAGIGNVFFGDDGFGVEVVHRIDPAGLPEAVDVVDYGIRGVHLAYELLDGRHDTLIMVDAVPLQEPPGTLAVLEIGPDEEAPAAVDAHSMNPGAVLGALRSIGGRVDRVLVVGCQPAVIDAHMGLSDPVGAAVDEAVRLVIEVATTEAGRERPAQERPGRVG